MASNLPTLAVASLAERLRITGFTGADVWADWVANDLDQLLPLLTGKHTFGQFVVLFGVTRPISRVCPVESATKTAVITDPGSREAVSAVKRWRGKSRPWARFICPTVLRGGTRILRVRDGRV